MVLASDQGAPSAPSLAFLACPPSKRPRGRPGGHWRDYISHLAWEYLRSHQEDGHLDYLH